jgi:hypothetical protein
LDAEELAAALGASRGTVYTRLSRLRQALEESVTALLVVRGGREACPRLDALVATFPPGPLSAEHRRAVSRHLNACDRCTRTRRRVVSPVALFGSFALVPMPPGLAEALWPRIAGRLNRGPHRRSGRPGARSLAALVAVAGAAAGVTALLLSLGGGEADVAAPRDPGDIRSSTYRAGVPGDAPEVRLEWTPPEGAQAFSFHWDSEPRSLPDTVADSAGSLAGTTQPIAPGERLYFHLRTQGPDGRWTSTAHWGPAVRRASPVLDPSPSLHVPDPSPSPTEAAPPALETPSSSPTAPAGASPTRPTSTPREPSPTVAEPGTATPTTVPPPMPPTPTPTATETETATASPTATIPPLPSVPVETPTMGH